MGVICLYRITQQRRLQILRIALGLQLAVDIAEVDDVHFAVAVEVALGDVRLVGGAKGGGDLRAVALCDLIVAVHITQGEGGVAGAHCHLPGVVLHLDGAGGIGLIPRALEGQGVAPLGQAVKGHIQIAGPFPAVQRRPLAVAQGDRGGIAAGQRTGGLRGQSHGAQGGSAALFQHRPQTPPDQLVQGLGVVDPHRGGDAAGDGGCVLRRGRHRQQGGQHHRREQQR